MPSFLLHLFPLFLFAASVSINCILFIKEFVFCFLFCVAVVGCAVVVAVVVAAVVAAVVLYCWSLLLLSSSVLLLVLLWHPLLWQLAPIIVVVLFFIVPRYVGCFCLAFILFVIPLCRKSCPAPCVRNMLICVLTRIFSYFLAVSDYAAAVATPCSWFCFMLPCCFAVCCCCCCCLLRLLLVRLSLRWRLLRSCLFLLMLLLLLLPLWLFVPASSVLFCVLVFVASVVFVSLALWSLLLLLGCLLLWLTWSYIFCRSLFLFSLLCWFCVRAWLVVCICFLLWLCFVIVGLYLPRLGVSPWPCCSLEPALAKSGAYSGNFWGQGLKVLKMSLLRPILATSAGKAWKCSKWGSWGLFRTLLEPRPEVLKMSLLRSILTTSGSNARKCSKWVFWGLFWPLPGPRPENAQNEPPEAYSGHFWGQGLKMLKMSLSGAQKGPGLPQLIWSGSKQTLRSNLATPGNGLKQTVQRKVISNWNPHGKGSFKANSSWKGQGCHSPLGVLPNKPHTKTKEVREVFTLKRPKSRSVILIFCSIFKAKE